MKLLDRRGYIYNVYDMGDGRVLKKEKPELLQYMLHFLHGRGPSYAKMHKERSRRIAKTIPDLGLIGNPVFLTDESYTQDKVEVIGAYFKSHSLPENKIVIDSYIECIYQCWKNGFSDLIFNFTRNNGVAQNGRVVLFDFNEVTFDKVVTEERLKIQRWKNTLSYMELPEGPLKEYYAGAMEEAMTLENLNRNWKDNPNLHE